MNAAPWPPPIFTSSSAILCVLYLHLILSPVLFLFESTELPCLPTTCSRLPPPQDATIFSKCLAGTLRRRLRPPAHPLPLLIIYHLILLCVSYPPMYISSHMCVSIFYTVKRRLFLPCIGPRDPPLLHCNRYISSTINDLASKQLASCTPAYSPSFAYIVLHS